MPHNNVTPLGAALDGSKVKATDELGLTGLKIVGGFTYEEFLAQLRGTDAIKVYREMSDNDPVVGAFVHAIDMILRGVDWHVEGADESPEAEKAAEFVRECMLDFNQGYTWQNFISEVMSMLVYGWSWFEVVYKKRAGAVDPDPWIPSEGMAPFNEDKRRGRKPASSRYEDGSIGWAKFAFRSQDSFYRWEQDEFAEVHGLWQFAPPKYDQTYVPLEKSLHFRTKMHKNNPEGRSILRNAYRAWFFKKRMEEIEAVGIERDLAGYPVAWIPAEMLTDDAPPEFQAVAKLFETAVKNTRRDAQEGLVLPQQFDPDTGNKLYEFQLLSTGGGRAFNTDAIVQRYDQRIAMTVLADLLLLGQDSVGSYALSTTKEGMLRASMTAWLDHIAEILNTVELPRLWRLNGFPEETMPKFTHGEVDTPTPAELGAYVMQLSGAGVPLFPNQELENHLLNVAKLPQRTEEEWKALWDMQQEMQQQQGYDQEYDEDEEFAADDEETVEEEEEFGPDQPDPDAKKNRLLEIIRGGRK